jgi:hypothetical protein
MPAIALCVTSVLACLSFTVPCSARLWNFDNVWLKAKLLCGLDAAFEAKMDF